MRRPLLLLSLPVVGLSAAMPARAPAQARWELGPYVALYLPTGSFQPAPYYSTALPSDPSDMTALAWGAETRLWLSRHVGLQVQAATSSSLVGGGATPAGILPPTSVHVFAATAQVLYNLHPPAATRAWLSGGGGIVRHGGAAYAPYGSPTQFAGALGAGASFPLYHQLRANTAVTTLWYPFSLRDSTGTRIEHGFQLDALIQVGVSLAWP